MFSLFVDYNTILENPNRLDVFLAVLTFLISKNMSALEIDIPCLHLSICRLVLCSSSIILARKNNSGDILKSASTRLLNFLRGVLFAGDSLLRKYLSVKQLNSLLNRIPVTNHILPLLSLPSSEEEKFFIHALIPVSCLVNTNKYKSTQYHNYNLWMSYNNFAFGQEDLIPTIQYLNYLPLNEISSLVLENIQKNLELHIQAWKYLNRLYQASSNVIKLCRFLAPTHAISSWEIVSCLLVALNNSPDGKDVDIKDQLMAQSVNPICKIYKQYKILPIKGRKNWEGLLKDLEELGSKQFVQEYINTLSQVTTEQKSKVTENFATLCISMIELVKQYETSLLANPTLYEEDDILNEDVKESVMNINVVYSSTFEQSLLTKLVFGSKVIIQSLLETVLKAKSKDAILYKYRYTYQLFCKLFAQMLLVMDDLEFVGRPLNTKSDNLTITQDNLKELCQLINMLVYRLYSESGAVAKYFSLRRDAQRLLNQLYVRERRNKIFPDDFWHIAFAKNTGPEVDAILQNIAHVIPFPKRVEILRKKLQLVRQHFSMEERQPLSVVIRRDMIFEDSLASLGKLGPFFKGNIHVQFTNKAGVIETGVGHGVFKEYLTVLSKYFNYLIL